MPNDGQAMGAGQMLVELRLGAERGGAIVEIATMLLGCWLFGFRGAFSTYGFGAAVLVGAARFFRTRRCGGRVLLIVFVAQLLAAMVVGVRMDEMLGELRFEREALVAANDGTADIAG